MQGDKLKVMTHLAHRTTKQRIMIPIAEIQSAWAFDNIDDAIRSLEQQGLIERYKDTLRITKAGIEALKKA